MPPKVEEKQVKTALNPQKGGFLITFTHSLQPYTGCAFGQKTADGQGCPYCYVRKLPVAQFANQDWGEWVQAKVNVADVLERELTRHAKRGTLGTLRIFMSSATDPYQGAEASWKLTRQCLEKFVLHRPRLLIVQTRSPLVTRDMDLLQQLGDCVRVSMTVETDDDRVSRRFTPTSPTITSRLKAMRALTQAGILVQATISPMLPNHPMAFAEALEPCCDRVLVDTLHHGDGANGRRSDALGMREMFRTMGYESWYHPKAHEELFATLRSVLGNNRVFFSQEGFNTW